MNLRHAATLALVGWYLMVPPAVSRQNWNRLMQSAPLGRWVIRDSFDSADACRKARDGLAARGEQEIDTAYDRWLAGRAPSDKLMSEWAEKYNALVAVRLADTLATCIASDDPRLKEK